jgi:hypothetical protein
MTVTSPLAVRRRPPPQLGAIPRDCADIDGERGLWFGAPSGDARYDGTWWRGGGDAEEELAWLLPRLQWHTGARVERVSLNIGAWPGPHPARVWQHDQLVRLEWFSMQDPRTVTLRSGATRMSLVVG